jgi:serine protease SohB
MAEFISGYGMFFLELVTIVILVGGAVMLIIASARGPGGGNGLAIRHMNEDIEHRNDILFHELLGKNEFKKRRKLRAKEKKKERKKRAGGTGSVVANVNEKPGIGARTGSTPATDLVSEPTQTNLKRRVFVLEFKGDIRATATASLREEISAILAVAADADEVLLRLENSGGTVHEHGLAASQLLRLKRGGVKLTVVVDKVAASGGYLMACVADRLVAAPFAIIGSIGVVAQLPNFHRFLEERGVDFEQVTAGRFKRTLTVFGQNTDEGREKLKAELEDIHDLFKQQIAEQRPSVDLDQVATGEHWYGSRALSLNLIDAIGTSDDVLREMVDTADLYSVSYRRKRSFQERLVGGAESLLSR